MRSLVVALLALAPAAAISQQKAPPPTPVKAVAAKRAKSGLG